jgi:hypothetical protein
MTSSQKGENWTIIICSWRFFFYFKTEKIARKCKRNEIGFTRQTWMWILIMQRGEKCVNCFSTFCLIYALLHLHGKQNWWDILDGAKYQYHGIKSTIINFVWLNKTLFFCFSFWKREKAQSKLTHSASVISWLLLTLVTLQIIYLCRHLKRFIAELVQV